MSRLNFGSYKEFMNEYFNIHYNPNGNKGNVELHIGSLLFDILHNNSIITFRRNDLRIDFKGLKGASQLTMLFLDADRINNIVVEDELQQIGIWFDNEDSYIIIEID